MPDSSKRPHEQTDRRRAGRAALSLSATMREGSRSKVQVRVIDISTHGCRVECTTGVPVDAAVWLSVPGLENQYCRVVWRCQEFVGVEFEKPLAEAVFKNLLSEQISCPKRPYPSCATSPAVRTGWRPRPTLPTSTFLRSFPANAPSTRWSKASVSAKRNGPTRLRPRPGPHRSRSARSRRLPRCAAQACRAEVPD